MIDSYSVLVSEVENVNRALMEVETQLAEMRLLRNTVGIASASGEMIDSGVYGAVAKALPFPILGSTAVSQAVVDKVSTFSISILVLTSDDCEFQPGLSDEISDESDVAELTKACYLDVCGRLVGSNKVTFLFLPPLIESHYPFEYVSALSAIDKTIPVFGTVANTYIDNFSGAKTLYGDQAHGNRFAMLLVSGAVTPKFYVGSVTKDAVILPEIGKITDSCGNIAMEINNTPATEFFENMGIVFDYDMNPGMLSTVFLLDIKDQDECESAIISRAVSHKTGDSIVSGGVLPTGATISIASVTEGVIMKTAKSVVDDIVEKHEGGVVLLYSCIGRRYALLNKPMKEFEFLARSLAGRYTYMAAVSSGEICPSTVTSSKAINHEHNHTLIACVLS